MRPFQIFHKGLQQIPGQMLVEVMVALALFMLLITGIVPLYLSVFKSNIRDFDQLRSDLYTQEGFEAVRSIRNRSFSNLINGTYGLSAGSGYWNFSGSSDIIGKFTRTITIGDAGRDATCVLVMSGGTTDVHTKIVTVNVSWDDGGTIPQQASSTQYLTDWKNPQGCEQASNIAVNLSGAALSSGNTRVINITLTNLGSSPITIDTIKPVWTNGNLIEEIKIASTIVWKYNSTGTPTGKQSSGTELDIDNVTLQPGSGTISLDHFLFSGSMSGTTFTLYFKMTDGTIHYGQVTL